MLIYRKLPANPKSRRLLQKKPEWNMRCLQRNIII